MLKLILMREMVGAMDLRLLGSNIKVLRARMKMSQEELAGSAKVARRAIQELELGRGNPTFGTIEAIAKVLKKQIVELISFEFKEEPVPPRPSPFENLTMSLGARILNYYQDAEPRRQLASLYILSKDRSFLAELANLPGGAQYAQVLEKLLKA